MLLAVALLFGNGWAHGWTTVLYQQFLEFHLPLLLFPQPHKELEQASLGTLKIAFKNVS